MKEYNHYETTKNETVKKCLLNLGLPETFWHLDEDYLKEKNAPKGKILLKKGHYEDKLRFLASGVIKITYCSGENSYVFDFKQKNNLVSDVVSLMEKIPSTFTFETISYCVWYEIDKNEILRQQKIKDLSNIMLKISNCYLHKIYHMLEYFRSNDAIERYRLFCKAYANVIQNASLGDIASFLNITQASLSRIRKEIAKE